MIDYVKRCALVSCGTQTSELCGGPYVVNTGIFAGAFGGQPSFACGGQDISSSALS